MGLPILFAVAGALLSPSAQTALRPATRLARARPLACRASFTTPRVSIEYCTRCNWMLRSAWLAQELLNTFNGTVGEVALVPNHQGGGTFECACITAGGKETVVWSRAEEGRFPEAKE
jgi:selenoprotein W-related protein